MIKYHYLVTDTHAFSKGIAPACQHKNESERERERTIWWCTRNFKLIQSISHQVSQTKAHSLHSDHKVDNSQLLKSLQPFTDGSSYGPFLFKLDSVRISLPQPKIGMKMNVYSKKIERENFIIIQAASRKARVLSKLYMPCNMYFSIRM